MDHLTAGEPLAVQVRAVARSQLGTAVDAIDQRDRREAVHDARRRCKQVRALVRLVRDAMPDTYRDVNRRLRDAARLVSDGRDAAAAVETHDALTDALGASAPAPYAGVRDLLVTHRDGPSAATVEARLPEVRARLAAVLDAVDDWTLPAGDGLDVLAAGYARTYDRARQQWRSAVDSPSTHDWHQWRKRVKYHRHHVDLLREAWQPVMQQREDLLHDLTDLLGDDHDLAELRRAVLERHAADLGDPTTAGYVGVLDARRSSLQHRALPLAARLFAQAPGDHAGLVMTWWRLAIADGGATTTDGGATSGAVTAPGGRAPVIPVDR